MFWLIIQLFDRIGISATTNYLSTLDIIDNGAYGTEKVHLKIPVSEHFGNCCFNLIISRCKIAKYVTSH